MKKMRSKNKVEAPINSGGNVIVGDGNTITVVQQPELSFEQLISDAKNSLISKAYKNAREILNKILMKTPDNADLYFYLALSLIEGRRPKTLGAMETAEIVRNLEMAIERDKSKAHYFYLKAIIQYDFYYLNGFLDDVSIINDLLAAAADADYDELIIKDMLRHTPGIDKEIVNCIIVE